jgi:heme exporter protein D
MSDWQTFLEMGGYAAYVWPAYGASLTALLVLGLVSWRQMKRVERRVALSETSDLGKQRSIYRHLAKARSNRGKS